MKVLEITPLKNKAGDDVWKVTLEGTEKPLWLGYAPKFTKGDDVPEDSIQLSKNQNSYIMKRATGQGGTKPAWKPAKNDDDILLSVAFKGAVECEGDWYVPDGKAHNDRVLKNTSELFDGLILLRPSHSKE